MITGVGRAAAVMLGALSLAGVLVSAAPLGARIAGHSSFIVTGRSMEPTIPIGALILVRPVAPDEVRIGDVVSLRNSRGVITHRVIAIERGPAGREFTLQGDANPVADVERIAFTDRAGLVVASVPYAGFVAAYARAYWRPAVAAAGLVLLFGAAFLLVRARRAAAAGAASPPELIADAAVMVRQGRRAAAVDALRTAIAIAPTDLVAHRRLAAMLLNDGDVAGATAEHARFERALRSAGDHAAAQREREYRATMLRWHGSLAREASPLRAAA